MVYCVKRFTLQHSAVIFIFEKDMKFPRLLDTYGVLLSDRKREILDYYFNEDYSLAEISELTGISRQGVRDSIRKSSDEILELESKLGIVKKNETSLSILRSVISELKTLSDRSDLSEQSLESDRKEEDRLKSIIDKLTEVGSILEPTHNARE